MALRFFLDFPRQIQPINTAPTSLKKGCRYKSSAHSIKQSCHWYDEGGDLPAGSPVEGRQGRNPPRKRYSCALGFPAYGR